MVSADLSVTQSIVSTALFNIRLKEATSGTFDRAAASVDAQSFSVPNVFTLSAKFSWGLGMTYESDGPIDAKAGAIMTTNNAKADFNVKGRFVTSSSGWEPQTQVTYPKFSKAGRAVIAPYIKTDIKVSMMIFGQMIKDAVVLTNQNNMAFDSQVLASSETISGRSVSTLELPARQVSEDVAARAEKRGFFSNIMARIREMQQRNQGSTATPPVKCEVGSMKLNSVVKTRTDSSVAGTKKNLLTQDYKFGAKW